MTTMLLPYNFRVDIGTTTLGFSQVTGIEVAYEHIVYRHGLSFREGENITTFPANTFKPITMQRGVVREGSSLFLYEWLTSRELRRIEVQLCDDLSRPRLLWRIAEAIPVKLSAPTFDANSNEVAIEVLELMAKGVTCVHIES